MLLFISFFLTGVAQAPGWEVFADTRFKWQWSEEFGAEVGVPVFSQKTKLLDGKEVILTGHYLPLEMKGNRIIISKFPYASCFFCGGSGQESVAEVVFNSAQRRFRMDELITVKGRLRLNVDDYAHLVFILEDATMIK